MDVDEVAKASAKVFEELMDTARDMETKSPDKAPAAYLAIVANKEEHDDPDYKGREKAVYALCDFYVSKSKANEIAALNNELRSFFVQLPKAKTAKIVRTLIDQLAKIDGTEQLQISMCRDCIAWCKAEKRTFLRQRVETRLSGLLVDVEGYVEAMELLSRLSSDVKKLDDKLLLVEIHLIESRCHHALQNIPKSKAALTAAKTNANAIHCPPMMQADIDLWSGILASREKDYRTAFSYFYEAFEAHNQSDHKLKATECLKLMLLSKIMFNKPQDTRNIILGKSGLKYAGPEIDAMAAIAKAHEKRCLKTFEACLEQYKEHLGNDLIVSYHLSDLNETLLEQNILRILEPFSKVEIAHVAELIELPLARVQSKLREMILDHKLNGTLDQGVGVLIVFEKESVRSTYDNTLKTIKNTSEVLDTLYGMAKQLV